MARGPGNITFLSDTTVGDVAAYTAGDQVGGVTSTALQWAGAGGFSGDGSLLQIVVTLQASVTAELDLFMYNEAFTVGTNNAAFVEAGADFGKCFGIVNIPAADFKSIGSDGFRATIKCVLGYQCADGTNGTLYGNLVARGALDLTVATVYVGIGVVQG